MFKSRYDELHSFLEWRRQTRFLRHYGGPILALGLFAACLGFVLRVCERKMPVPGEGATVEQRVARDVDRKLQAMQFSKR